MHRDDHLTLVPDYDWQTGLPTLLRFCTDLHALLECNTALTLVTFNVRSTRYHWLDSVDAAVMSIVQLVTEMAQPYAQALFYRTATDSFALVLPGVSRGSALQWAEKLRRCIVQQQPDVSTTFAVGSAPHDAATAGALIAVCEAQLLGDGSQFHPVRPAMPMESLPPSTAHLANALVERMVALVAVGQHTGRAEREAA